MVGGCSKFALRAIDRVGAAVQTQSRHWHWQCTGEEVRYVTRYTLHYFFVAFFPLPSVSGYSLGAALNTSSLCSSLACSIIWDSLFSAHSTCM